MELKTIIGWAILACIGFSLLGGLFNAADDYYLFPGLGFLIFGTWGGILLIRDKKTGV
jgi:hypothetical protein